MKQKNTVLILMILCSTSLSQASECTGLLKRFSAYQQQAVSTNTKILAHLKDNAETVQDWYSQRWQDEGRSLFIPVGTYEAIGNSALKMKQSVSVAQMMFQANEIVATSISTELARCLK